MGVDVQIYIFLISARVGGEWSDSRSGRFIPGEREPGTRWIGVWVGPRAGLDDMWQNTCASSNKLASKYWYARN
jgi:hypothetical protein